MGTTYPELPDFFNSYAEFLNVCSTSNWFDRGKCDPTLFGGQVLDSFNKKVENGKQLLLVCHDYKGNYLEQDVNPEGQFICKHDGTDDGYPFIFPGMSYTDVFVYFSHKLISIPPKRWVKAAHIHGIVVLGTILVEHDHDKPKFYELLDDPQFPVKLGAFLEAKNVDGILLNIEVDIDAEYLPKLVKFVAAARRFIHGFDPPVIWYDAVCVDGKLNHQNSLNSQNKRFFKKAGFIFLDYKWEKAQYGETVKNAGKSYRQVFFGVDMFARNTPSYGEGVEGLLKARSEIPGASLALFAPGYVHEKSNPKIDCNATIMEVWKPFFDFYSPSNLLLNDTISLGSPYSEYERGSDGQVKFCMRPNHVFPLYPKSTEELPQICGTKMKFTSQSHYHTIVVREDMVVKILWYITGGYVELASKDTTVRLDAGDFDTGKEHILLQGEYRIHMIPEVNGTLELRKLVLEIKKILL